jgi:hypothetical protein
MPGQLFKTKRGMGGISREETIGAAGGLFDPLIK